MTHILITDLREIRYMAYVPDRVKRLDYAFQFKYDNAIAEYNAALEKAKRESILFDDITDCRYIEAMIKMAMPDRGAVWNGVQPGIYQVPVEVEIVEICGYDGEDCVPHCNECTADAKQVARIVQPKEEEPKYTAEDFFKTRFHTEHWDKHDKKIQRYDYYDMIDFAEQYAKVLQGKEVNQ